MAVSGLLHLIRKLPAVRGIQRFIRARFPQPRKFEHFNKVFCIGWLKTGTTSFGSAMQMLGFKHCGFDPDVWRDWYQQGDIDRVIRYARHFESFDDLPWNKVEILEALDKAFPNSKYILLERDEASWSRSLESHRSKSGWTPSTEAEAAEALSHYRSRNEFVREYFRGEKSQQLLTMNVIQGEGFETLCPFLGIPVLDQPFPHANKSKVARSVS